LKHRKKMKKMNSKTRLSVITLLLVALVAGCQNKPSTSVSNTVRMYVGTYTNGTSKGIYKVDFDTVTGQFSNDTLVAELLNPSYLTLSQNGRYLAAVSEDDNRSAMLYTFAVDSATGMLTPLSNIETGGQGPCYVSTIGDTLVCTANYSSGSVCFTPAKANGELMPGSKTFQHSGSGPNANRQQKAHAHNIIPDNEGVFVYSADLGADKLMVYKNNADSVIFAKEIAVSAGAGPRHIAFHPTQPCMAVVNELIPAVELYGKDADGVFSVKTHTALMLPDTLTGANTAADIHFSPDGRFVYATNRGFDFVAVFKVSDNTTHLELVERVHGPLNWPRNFAIDPSGKFVLVANQNGHNVVVYARNAQTGKLTDTGQRLQLGSPVCLKF
jgi:6-phosphogluconolactonase